MLKANSASAACVGLTHRGFQVVTPGQLRVLYAVDALYAGNGNRGVGIRELMGVLGARSPYFVWQCLIKLKRAGLVSYHPGLAKTLIPTFRFAPRPRP